MQNEGTVATILVNWPVCKDYVNSVFQLVFLSFPLELNKTGNIQKKRGKTGDPSGQKEEKKIKNYHCLFLILAGKAIC